MPQMSPLNWLSLMILFILIFIMFNAINYFSFMYHPKTKVIQTTKKMTNWKW
uniref:ATP synthase complex subunit 8 n=1 Tax=Tenebrionoidea sp. 17 KM-2017 TaxID=2219472 RepID=A0A346RKH6_9CUCU|nr:ATP synthase F0 subunit 8 [Tenebrionoidea sp. 17 KM-2017]